MIYHRRMENALVAGSKVYLRPVEPADAPTLVPWFNDPEVIANTSRYRPVTRQDEEEFFEAMRKSTHDVLFGIALAADDRLVGVTGLHDIHARCRHAEMGIRVGDKAMWGQGVGSEASALITGDGRAAGDRLVKISGA